MAKSIGISLYDIYTEQLQKKIAARQKFWANGIRNRLSDDPDFKEKLKDLDDEIKDLNLKRASCSRGDS